MTGDLNATSGHRPNKKKQRSRHLNPEPNESKAKSTSIWMCFRVNQQLPILPGRFQPSTFGVCELNYRVRHGYGCILTGIATESLRVSVLSKLYRRKVFRRAFATWSRL